MKFVPESGSSSAALKDMNARAVLRALRLLRRSTSRDLAASTGLSMMTVNSILQDLTSASLAAPGSLVPSNGGRPAREYVFNERHSLAAVLFTREVLGRNTLCVRVADLYGAILHSRDLPLKEASFASFEKTIDELLPLFPKIGVIAFGLPGIEFEGTLVALDYPLMEGKPLIPHFSARYALPVICENDVNAAAFGRGLASGAPASEAYIYLPAKYPPGCGIRLDGRILKGRRNFAGEVAWLPFDIPWGTKRLIESPDKLADALSLVVTSLSAVLAPESVVLFGEFLADSHLARVGALCEKRLPPGMAPALSLAEDFTADFECGLVGLALKIIE